MLRKIIGTMLVILGGLGIIILIFGGGPVLPHVIGPTALAVVGTLILTFKRKANDFIQRNKNDELKNYLVNGVDYCRHIVCFCLR